MCQFARLCQWDLRRIRASIAQMPRQSAPESTKVPCLPRNIHLRLRKCCACHAISSPIQQRRIPYKLYLSLKARPCHSMGPGPPTPKPSSVRRRDRGSFQHCFLRFPFPAARPPLRSRMNLLFVFLFVCTRAFQLVPVARKFLLSFLWSRLLRSNKIW